MKNEGLAALQNLEMALYTESCFSAEFVAKMSECFKIIRPWLRRGLKFRMLEFEKLVRDYPKDATNRGVALELLEVILLGHEKNYQLRYVREGRSKEVAA